MYSDLAKEILRVYEVTIFMEMKQAKQIFGICCITTSANNDEN